MSEHKAGDATQAHRRGCNDGLAPTDAVGHEDSHTGNGDEAEHQHHGVPKFLAYESAVR